MITRILRSGGTYYLPLPESVLADAGITDHVNLTVEDGRLVIRPARQPRAGWAEAIAERPAEGPSALP